MKTFVIKYSPSSSKSKNLGQQLLSFFSPSVVPDPACCVRWAPSHQSPLVPLLPLAQALPAGFARFPLGTPLPSGSPCAAKPASPQAPQPAAAPEYLLEGLCWMCVGMCWSRQQLLQVGKSPMYARDDMPQIPFPSLFCHRLRMALRFTL